MFSMTSFSPAKLKGTIRVAKPIRHLGHVTDINGNRWHVEAIIGNQVCAVPMAQLHPYFTDTSGDSFGFVSQRWEPYQVEVVSNQ